MSSETVKCGIQHGFGDQTCNEPKGHEGPCRCKAERHGENIMYSEWYSKDGRFHRHKQYVIIYPANALKEPS